MYKRFLYPKSETNPHIRPESEVSGEPLKRPSFKLTTPEHCL